MKYLAAAFGLVLLACTPVPEVGEHDEFAQCLWDGGVRMYGSFLCSVCDRQRDLFGPSFHLLNEIECHPQGENSQTDLCLDREIEKTPTWLLEKDGEVIDHKEGYQTLETLAEWSGCPLN